MFSSDNLIEPLVFDDGEIDRFIQRHRCAIHDRLHLLKTPVDGRRWTANCPECGPLYDNNAISTHIAESIQGITASGMIELRKKSGLSAEEIIKSLGF